MSQRTLARLARAAVVTTRRVVVTVAVLVCVLGLGSVLAVSAANRWGYQVLGMKTGSMQPAIDPGDLVVAQRLSPADIGNGDVITFRAPTGSQAPYTHRVVRTVHRPDGPEFVTQGDANAAPDLWTVHYVAEGWRVAHVLPRAGKLIAFEQSAAGRRIVAASVFVVTIALLWPVFARRPDEAAPIRRATTFAPKDLEVVA